MTAAVLFAVRKPQPDLDPQERLPDDPVIWHRALDGLKPGTRISQKKAELITCSGIELVHPWQVVAQACAGSG